MIRKIVKEGIKSFQNWWSQWKGTCCKPRKPTSQIFSAGRPRGHSIYQNNKECAGERGITSIEKLIGCPMQTRLTVGNAMIKLGYLMAKVMIGSGNNRAQMSVIYYQEQSGCNYCNEQQGQSGSRGFLTCRELWWWLIEHGVPRSKRDGNPSRFLLHRLSLSH